MQIVKFKTISLIFKVISFDEQLLEPSSLNPTSELAASAWVWILWPTFLQPETMLFKYVC